MIAEWPQGVKKQITEAKEDYIIADLNMAQLRNSRVNAREFRQRRAGMFTDLAKDSSIAEMYGVKEEAVIVPAPSAEAKSKVLERSGVIVKP
jgi:hypothetical protein